MWKKFFGLAYPMGWVNKNFELGLSIGYRKRKKLRSGNAEGPIKWKFRHVTYSIGYRSAGKFEGHQNFFRLGNKRETSPKDTFSKKKSFRKRP